MIPVKDQYTIPIPIDAKILNRKDGKWAKFKRKGKEYIRPLTEKGDKDRVTIRMETNRYSVYFKHQGQKEHRVSLFENEQASIQFANNLQDLLNYRAASKALSPQLIQFAEQMPDRIKKALIKIGVDIDSEAPGDKKIKPLKELLEEHIEWLTNSLYSKHGHKRTKKHIKLTYSRITQIMTNCNFVIWTDIMPSKIENYLGGFCENPNTYKGWANMFKAFCQWAVDNGYAMFSPVAGKKLKMPYADDETDKRAFAQEEIVRLLESAANGPVYKKMTGPERTICYLMALESGLRAGTVFNLKKKDFDYDNNKINIRPEIHKNRTRHTVYLKPERSRQIREYLKNKEPDALFFQTTKDLRAADMVKFDLKRTEILRTTGEIAVPAIPYKDSNGLKAGFHSFRRTFDTTLNQITKDKDLINKMLGNKPKKGDMVRHYRDISEEEMREVIAQLPNYKWPEKRQAVSSTGTDGKAIEKILPKSCEQTSPKTNQAEPRRTETSDNAQKTAIKDQKTGEQCVILPPNNSNMPDFNEKNNGFSGPKKFLPESCSGPTPADIAEIWADLPEQTKAEIKSIIEASEARRGGLI